jgi:hypothetical protein
LSLSEAAFSAADIDGNSIINATDYSRVKSFFLGDYVFPSIEKDDTSDDTTSDDTTSDDSSGVESETKTNYAFEKSYTVTGDFLSGKDDNGSLITDGVLPTSEATNSTLAFAGTGSSNSITINLNAKYVDVNEIVVAGVVLSGNRQYATVTIEVSADGYSFTKLTGYTTSSEQYASNVYKYKYKLASNVIYAWITFFKLYVTKCNLFG